MLLFSTIAEMNMVPEAALDVLCSNPFISTAFKSVCVDEPVLRQAEMQSSPYLYKGNTIQRMRCCDTAATGGGCMAEAHVSVCMTGG